MSYNGTELSALMDDYIHNDAGMTATRKLQYLTMGQQRIIHDLPFVIGTKEATLSLTLALGRTYSLASDFYMMESVFLPTTSVKMTPVLHSEMIDSIDRLASTPSGTPSEYTILGYDTTIATPACRIRFNYTPDASYTVYYWYKYMPAAITATAIPALSYLGFDELLVLAASMIALQPKDPQGYAYTKQCYEQEAERARQYRPMQADHTPVLRSNWYDHTGSTLRLSDHFPVE